ncbi:sporulation protein YpjB [Chengkuizengella axinellae]|uniref:Sporulation protein YpjB n=1 Tax=Chengkuizengella axinellae TaxID=3064388 RepID=A0ABT9IWV2_9BACL|nr:sporulation protein YpjB [Chengkuizengella sp. 2205SS18-9]MDP5273826.1 sporulation protein YpjB [Chengkuizengella sp. 2205SS18-9]
MFRFNSKSTFRVYMLLIVFSFVLISGCSTNEPEHSAQKVMSIDEEKLKQLETMNMLANEMYQKTTEENYIEARDILLKLSEQLAELNYDGLTSIEGIQALSSSIVNAKRNFNSVNMSKEDALISSAKIHLAIDALSHQKEPMWLQYYSVLNSDLEELQKSVQLSEVEKANGLLETFKKHYGLIRPAMIINREPEHIEQLDSYIIFLQNNISDVSKKENINTAVEGMILFMNELFLRDETSGVIPFEKEQDVFSWIISIGTIIVSVLFYAGWRRYDYEKTHVVSVRK